MLLLLTATRPLHSNSSDAKFNRTVDIELRARSELGGAHRREVGWVRAEQPPRGPEVIMKLYFTLQDANVEQQDTPEKKYDIYFYCLGVAPARYTTVSQTFIY